MKSEKVKEIKKALKYCCQECDCDCSFYRNGETLKEFIKGVEVEE